MKGLYSSHEHSPDLTADDIAAMRANYAGKVALIDDEIGEIVETIRRRGELEQTLIAFTSDHGEMNGDHGLIYKGNFLDPAIKIPLIIVPPPIGDDKDAGKVSSALVELMDVGATLTDYAEAQLPSSSRARSLRPLIENRALAHRSIAVSEFAGHTCAVTPEIKVEFDPLLDAVLAFDRLADPKEQNDVSHDMNYQRAIIALRTWLDSFRVSTPCVSAVVDDSRLQQ